MDLVWNVSANKVYTHGVDRGVLFTRDAAGAYETGVAWDGLISVTKSPEGAEPTDLYANNVKYATMLSAENLKGTIEAYTYPDEFSKCDGSMALDAAGGVFVGMQPRSGFGLAFRSMIGSDAAGPSAGYKIHLLYGALCSPSEQAMSTINDSPEAATMSWEFSCTAENVGGTFEPSAMITIDSTKCTAAFLTWLEAQLYGDSPTNDPTLPSADTVRTQAVALV